jgi:hypothetical protein
METPCDKSEQLVSEEAGDFEENIELLQTVGRYTLCSNFKREIVRRALSGAQGSERRDNLARE